MRDIVIKCGKTLSWDIRYGGEPEPEAVWYFNDKQIETSADISIETRKKNSIITLKNCQRCNSGKYKLVLTNSSGSVSTEADGVVLGKPLRPTGPLEVSHVRAKKATLNWKKPEDDGGTPITHYTIEKMDLDTGNWVPCGEVSPDETEFQVDGLKEGKKYKFRVSAVNKEGKSEPLESQTIEAKNPYTVPDPPRNLTIFDWDNKSVTLHWETPLRNGGRPITHYIIEQKGKFDSDFFQVLKTKDANLEALVEDLREKSVYEWRARAVNKAGPSEPCDPTPKHLVKHRHRKNLFRQSQDDLSKRFMSNILDCVPCH